MAGQEKVAAGEIALNSRPIPVNLAAANPASLQLQPMGAQQVRRGQQLRR